MVTTLIVTRTVQIAASILITGIFTFDLILRLTTPSHSDDLNAIERCLFRLAFWSLIAALLSALLWFWLEVSNMSGLSLKNALSTARWGTVFVQTQFGRVWQLRLGLMVAACILVAVGLAKVRVPRAMLVVLWLASIVLLAWLAWISHAAASTANSFGPSGDMLHLCAGGLWIGGLVPLAIFLARTPPSFSLCETVAGVARRFSTLSLFCVSVLVVSGISNGWLLVGSIHALFTTPYGRLLLVKLTLFAILLAIGARNRFLIKTKPLKGPYGANALAQLRRNVICEALLGLAVVVIVACLGVTPPARQP